METQLTIMQENDPDSFYVEGAMGMEVIGGLVALGLGAFLFMLISVVGGKTFSVLEDDIAVIGGAADYNSLASDYIADQIDGNILLASRASFTTIRDLTDLVPIFAYLFVFGALAVIVANLTNTLGGGGGGIRSAL